jgi:agmatine/peptidylarginine deiminase
MQIPLLAVSFRGEITMRFISLFIFSFILQAGCGRTESVAPSASLIKEATAPGSFTLIPEYAPTSAVMLSPGHRLLGQYVTDEKAGGSFKRLGAEYEAMLKGLAAAAGDTRLIVYARDQLADEAPPWFSPPGSEFEHFQSAILPSLLQSGVKVELRPTAESDPWTRDYGVFSARDNSSGQKVLIDYYPGSDGDKRGEQSNRDLAALRGEPLVTIANTKQEEYYEALTGGGLMVDSRGRCFAAPVSPDSSWGCSEVILFPSLPQDGTGHIDLFAKLLSDEVAVVADFAEEGVLLATEPELDVAKCDPDCKTIETREPTPSFEKDAMGHDRLFSIAELRELLKARYGEKNLVWTSTNSRTPSWQEFHLKEFSAKTAAKLSAKGFKVHAIINPAPIAYVSIRRHLDAQNRVTFEMVALSFAYRSYLNSLVMNGHVITPSFKSAAKEQNEAAMKVYRSLGFEVTPIPMDHHAFQAGAVHCLTHDLH